MVIAIDISPLEGEHRNRGTGSYINNLIGALEKHKNNKEYIFFTRKQNIPNSAELIHFPYFDPFFLTLPIILSKPTVVTVHDLIPIWFPEHFSRGVRGDIKWQLQKFSLLRSTGIITDSNYSREMIHSSLGYSLDKIWAILLAANEIFFRAISYENLERVSKRYRLPQKYVLYVGDVNWNKNIPGLIRSFHLVHESIKDIFLVLGGKAFTRKNLTETKEIDSLVKGFGLEKYVIKTGYIDQEDLQGVYSKARVYVQPSFAEGFGLPVLEAMSSGCPTVVADKTSLTEIAGPSVLVDPFDTASMAQGIITVLRKNRNSIGERARSWARNFSWRLVAQETTGVYEKILARI